MREKCTVLWHIAYAPRFRGEVGPGVLDHLVPERHAAGVGVLEPGQYAQERRFTTARRAEDGRERALGHLEVETVQHDPGAERLPQPGDDNACHVLHQSSLTARQRSGRQTVEPAAQEVGGDDGHRQHGGGERGGGAVREVGGVGPELRGQCLYTRGHEDQSSR